MNLTSHSLKLRHMRAALTLILLWIITPAYPQSYPPVLISGIVIGTDSVPIANVIITNVRTGKKVLSSDNGFFQTEISGNDSLFVYHIAYKRRFINEHNNGKYIILEPEVQELMQIDVIDDKKQTENLKETVDNIKKLAQDDPKDPGYDPGAKTKDFVSRVGSHDKAFSPYFGPTVKFSISDVVGFFSRLTKKHKTKK